MGNIYDAIMGLVVGDALGVPYEFRKRDTFKAEDMTGHGTHNQPPGTWSDDSSMTLATLGSLVTHKGKIFPVDIMSRFAGWLENAEYTARGEVFYIGGTTHNAILRYLTGVKPKYCGGTEEHSNGNGSLMRILPLAFTQCSDQQIVDVSALTHAHIVSVAACVIYVKIAQRLLRGIPASEAVRFHAWYARLPEYKRLAQLEQLSREEIRSTGYVVDTLEAALWCLLKTDSYRDCVLTAVNLGDDTDTVAAVAGGLAGILYGVGGDKGIPEEWIKQTAKHKEIKDMCSAFERRVLK